MSFPRKTKYLKRPIGWRDMGKVERKAVVINGENCLQWSSCPICISDYRVYRDFDENVLARYCPRCMVTESHLNSEFLKRKKQD